MNRLTALSYSPWSEKARWVLDHHHISYVCEEYVPFIGELRLRLRMLKLRGRVTVPVFYDGKTWFNDSFDIVRHVDRIGSGVRLFPQNRETEVELWNRRSEAALAAGRAMAVLSAASAPDGSSAAIPPLLRPFLGPVARMGLEAFISKYRMREGAELHEQVVAKALDDLDNALVNQSSYLIGGAFSYADIAMAVVLQFVIPVDERYMPSAPPGLEPFKNETLANRYPRLLAWRDELYAKHRLSGKQIK